MLGKYVSRRFYWDCHGVPIEHEIDKQYGKPTREVIEEFGLQAHTDACRGVVQNILMNGAAPFPVLVATQLIMIIKPWIAILWNRFGGCLNHYGTKALFIMALKLSPFQQP